MAVIRLAKPQMDTDTDSLADRIRQMERMLQSGRIPAAPAPAMDLGPEPELEPEPEEDDFFAGLPSMASMRNTDVFADLMGEEAAAPAPPAAPAASETGTKDVWGEIVRLCENPRIRFTLNKCSAEITGNRIRVYAANDFAVRQLREDEVITYIRQLAGQASGREMEILIAPAGSMPEHTASGDGFPDELLKNINFNIGTEEY